MKELPDFCVKCVRNSAICLVCGDEVESKSGHDFRNCKCGNMFVDGGLNYIRRGAKDFKQVKDTSQFRSLTKKELNEDIIYWLEKIEDDKQHGYPLSKWNEEELEKRELALLEYSDLLDGKIITRALV